MCSGLLAFTYYWDVRYGFRHPSLDELIQVATPYFVVAGAAALSCNRTLAAISLAASLAIVALGAWTYLSLARSGPYAINDITLHTFGSQRLLSYAALTAAAIGFIVHSVRLAFNVAYWRGWLRAARRKAGPRIPIGLVLAHVDRLRSYFTEHQPSREDLVGTYSLSPESVQYLRSKSISASDSTKVLLLRDGSFSLRAMPSGFFTPMAWLEPSRNPPQELQDFRGTWQSSNLLISRPNGNFSYPGPALVSQTPPYKLLFILIDADHPDALAFQK